MSATWWGFQGATAAPFARDLPVAHLWAAPAHREWAARFAAVVADRGVAVLTGDAGVGKSTALRGVWETLSPNQYLPLYLPASDDWTPRPCYRRLAPRLGAPPARFPEATEQQVRDTLWTLATQPGRQPVLAVDEAQLLPPRLLQELRFLLNYPRDSTAPVALVLCGHTELRHKLALRPLDAIRQRVTVAYHLPPLTAAEAGPYVTHQLQQVGVDRPVFTDHALPTGWEWSRGLPRRLNTLGAGLPHGGLCGPDDLGRRYGRHDGGQRTAVGRHGVSRTATRPHRERGRPGVAPALLSRTRGHGTWDSCGQTMLDSTQVYRYLHDSELFRALPVLPGAQAGVARLRDLGWDPVVVTAADPPIHAAKAAWLAAHFPEIPRDHLVFCRAKYLIPGGLFIDDAPHNLRPYRAHHPEAAVATLAYPYNRGLAVPRYPSWTALSAAVRSPQRARRDRGLPRTL